MVRRFYSHRLSKLTQSCLRPCTDRGNDVPRLAADCEDRLAPAGPSIVYEGIDSAKLSYGGINHTLSRIAVHEIILVLADRCARLSDHINCLTSQPLAMQQMAPRQHVVQSPASPRGSTRTALMKSHLLRRSDPPNPTLVQRKPRTGDPSGLHDPAYDGLRRPNRFGSRRASSRCGGLACQDVPR